MTGISPIFGGEPMSDSRVADGASAELQRLRRVLKVNSRIAEIFLRVSDDEMYGEVLQAILDITSSKHGVFGYIDEGGDLVCPSMTHDIWQQCQISDKRIVFPRTSWSDAMWCQTLRDNRVICQNSPGRVPEGHVPIARSISVPIVFQETVIGLLQVANKPADYSDEDIRLLADIAGYIAPILHARMQRDRSELETDHAEKALKESESRFRTTFEQASVGIAHVDLDGRWMRVNQQLCDILGYSHAELATLTFQEITHPEDLAADLDYVRRLLAGEIASYSMEKRYLRKARSIVWVQVTVALRREPSGEPKYFIAVVEDINVRKQMQEELESIARFPSENPYPVMRVAKDGALPYANAAAKPLISGVAPQHAQFPASLWQRHTVEAIESGRTRMLELCPGDKIVSFTVVPVPGMAYANWYGQDVTEQREAECEARRAQAKLLDQQRSQTEGVAAELQNVREQLMRKTRLAAIGQVSASIAHDLRNPLGSVRNAAYYLKRHVPTDRPEMAEFLQIIEDEVGSADRIIDGLLELTRARPVRRLSVPLQELVEGAFQRVAKTDRTRCQVVTEPDPFLIHVDPDQMRQVFVNLADNAVQAMEGDGRLLVRANRTASSDLIFVRDTGPGVPPELQAEIFEPLVTNRAKGTGLGLTICRQIVQRHGGALELIQDELPGATFRITLPNTCGEPS